MHSGICGRPWGLTLSKIGNALHPNMSEVGSAKGIEVILFVQKGTVIAVLLRSRLLLWSNAEDCEWKIEMRSDWEQVAVLKELGDREDQCRLFDNPSNIQLQRNNISEQGQSDEGGRDAHARDE